MHAWDKQQSIKSMTVFNSYKCSKSQSLLSSTPVSLWIKAGGKMNQTLLSSALTGSHGAGWASRGPLREASSHPCKHHQPGPAAGGARSRRGRSRVPPREPGPGWESEAHSHHLQTLHFITVTMIMSCFNMNVLPSAFATTSNTASSVVGWILKI